eukprot:UC1_evm3s1252
MYLEHGAPWLILAPLGGGAVEALLRVLVVAAYAGLHIGIAATMRLGIYSAVCLVAWTALVPGAVWELFGWRGRGAVGSGSGSSKKMAATTDSDCVPTNKNASTFDAVTLAANTATKLSTNKGKTNSSASSQLLRQQKQTPNTSSIESCLMFQGTCVNALALLALLAMWSINCRNLSNANVETVPALLTSNGMLPAFAEEPLETVANVLRLNQKWDMFSPHPATHEGWIVMPARLNDGRVVDLWHDGAAVDWDRPQDTATTMPNWRWRKLMGLAWYDMFKFLQPNIAQGLCRQYYEIHRDAYVVELRVWYLER